MTDWQPIATAPKDGTWVLLGDFKEALAEEHSYGVARFHDGIWQDGYQPKWYWDAAFDPTHWKPLPPPPDQGEAG